MATIIWELWINEGVWNKNPKEVRLEEIHEIQPFVDEMNAKLVESRIRSLLSVCLMEDVDNLKKYGLDAKWENGEPIISYRFGCSPVSVVSMSKRGNKETSLEW